MRTLRSGVSRGTETLVFRGGVPEPASTPRCGRRSRRATSRAGEVRLPQRRRRRARARRRCVGRTVFCLYPHQTAYVVPARAVVVVPDDVPAGARRAGRHRRDRGQRAVGRRTAGRRPGRRRRRGHGRLLRRPAARPDTRGRRSPSSTSTPAGPGSPPRSASTSRCPGDAAGGRDLVVHTSATVGRAAAVAGPARAGGHASSTSAGTATREVAAVARRGVPLRPAGASGPARSARCPRPGAAAGPRPTGWRSRSTCCATRRSTRCSPASRRFEELPDVMARLADGQPARAVPHRSPTARE